MRILAIIPARAGSKGIPNKNIRYLCGHPMIYYTIQNALRSSYITDVIVSTDSPEVRIIANQMGVQCRVRSPELCADNVTLDAVIYDAIPQNENYDYVITMQPTSPTLQVHTLDQAIAYAVENDLDTLISVINAPKLSWKEYGGKKIPNYVKRLNRQYLPPCYNETGAFVISKADIVTPDTRIGDRLDVFEISENEAVDVDSFSDLLVVNAFLKQEKVAIYVNGNNKRGVGHIYRALELADEFYSKPDIYYDINQTDCSMWGNTTHTLIPINGIAELFQRCKEKEYTIFINDILTTSIDYMIGLRSVLPRAKIVNFEDDGEGATKADLVFNALYSKNDQKQVYAGERYYIAAKTFLFYPPIQILSKVHTVFIGFGGADPQNYSDQLLEIVSKPEYRDFRFVVVLGRAKTNVDKLMEYNRFDHIQVMYDVSNMPQLMSTCDIALTSRGRTGYELAMLGIPTIAMAQNEREKKHGFVCEENGFTYLGLSPSAELIEANLKMYLNMSQEQRQIFHEKMLKHDLRNGRGHVMALIQS